MNGRRLAAALAALALSVSAAPSPGAEKTVTVGGKNFTEQYLLSNMAKLLLEHAGFQVEDRWGVGSTVARRSLEAGQTDLYYEYTGTAYTVYHKQSDPEVMNDPKRVYEWVKRADAEQGLVWLPPLPFNNTYTIMMRREEARKRGVESLSDLRKVVPGDFVIGVGAEFYERPDGLKKMAQVYGLDLGQDNVRKMDLGITYRALREGQVDAAMGFATDGRIAAFGFVTLRDDKDFFPVYNPAPVVRKPVLEAHPEIADVLAPLTGRLDTDTMRALNARVDLEHRQAEKVAEQWLKEQGLL